MSVLALDLGGSHVGCAVVERGQVLACSTVDTDARSLSALLPRLKAELLGHCHALSIEPQSCRGLSIGVPAVVDSQRSEILSTLGKFEDVSGAEILAWSERELGVPAKLENDAKLALLGEHRAGAGQGFEDIVMVTLGTGIGVAAMLQTRLLHSRLGQAGCLGGHICIRMEGRPCVCGGIGCAEAEASTVVLPALCREWPGFPGSLLAHEPVLDFAALFQAIDAGDTVARQVLDRCIQVWASLTVALIHAYGPERVLFGGGVMRRSSDILPGIRSFVDEHSWKTRRGAATIEVALLGEMAALVGAEVLFSEEIR